MSTNTKQLLAYLLVAVASIVGSIYVTNYSDNRNAELRVKLEKQRIVALKKVCHATVADRLILIKSAQVTERANRAVALDKSTDPDVRKIRIEQAEVQREAISDLRTRVDPANGGTVVCDDIK